MKVQIEAHAPTRARADGQESVLIGLSGHGGERVLAGQPELVRRNEPDARSSASLEREEDRPGLRGDGGEGERVVAKPGPGDRLVGAGDRGQIRVLVVRELGHDVRIFGTVRRDACRTAISVASVTASASV